MVVRDGETLSRIGKMAELFDDHSPLQLHASGVWNGQDFRLLGRLQYKYPEGTWTEWHALLGDGSSAFLSEDNGSYVFTTNTPVQREMPAAEQFRLGATTQINGKTFSVASNQTVALISAQGELPRLPKLGESFAMVELRSAEGEVLSVDYSVQPPAVCMGRSVTLDDLKLQGLKDESAKDEKGRQFNCPNCGATLSLMLPNSKSLTCSACHSIIDVSQGIGGELKHAQQHEPVNPLIPLGTIGLLQGSQWQVVGYQHRMGYEPSDPDEHFGWDEYLLYNKRLGFSFLVDSTEGWSIVKPATGAPTVSSNGQAATYLGMRYGLKESYLAETNYVVGEFYWQVTRGQKTSNRDYANGASMLSMEQSANELTWSVGGKVGSDVVAKAFKLNDKSALFQRSDVGVGSFQASSSVRFWIIIVVVLILMAILLSRCSSRSDCDPNTQNCYNNSGSGYRTSGGSWGGYSGGGGHK